MPSRVPVNAPRMDTKTDTRSPTVIGLALGRAFSEYTVRQTVSSEVKDALLALTKQTCRQQAETWLTAYTRYLFERSPLLVQWNSEGLQRARQTVLAQLDAFAAKYDVVVAPSVRRLYNNLMVLTNHATLSCQAQRLTSLDSRAYGKVLTRMLTQVRDLCSVAERYTNVE